MATVKFQEPSPYLKKNQIPAEDYLYKKFRDDVAQSNADNHAPVKIALFGAGRAGTIHLATLVNSRRVKLMYIVDDNVALHNRLKQYWKLDDVKFLTGKQSAEVFSNSSIDAVVIASPTYTHEEYIIKALQAKKAVFCEKPIAEKRKDVMKCYKTAKDVGKPLFCAFNRRFDPAYGSARDQIREGKIGHVHMMKCTARDSPIPTVDYIKTSGGIYHDCIVHDVDLQIWVLGELPDRVSSQASAIIPEIRDLNDFDTVAVTLHYPSGTLGMIDISRNSPYGYDQRIEAFGPKGSLQVDNEQPCHSTILQSGIDGLRTPPIWYSFPSRFRLAYEREMNHFLDIITKKTESKVNEREILAVCKIIDACEESARTGKQISLSWGSDEMLN